MKKNSLYLILVWSLTVVAHPHIIKNGSNLQPGDSIASFSIAKLLSLKFDIPFYFDWFNHADLFTFESEEKKLHTINPETFTEIYVKTEQDILDNLNRTEKILFAVDIRSQINTIHPKHIALLKKSLTLKKDPGVSDLPKNIITVAVHIRKGNGGGQYYDGEQVSAQQYNFNRTVITYLYNYFNYPFDWDTYQRAQEDSLHPIINMWEHSVYTPYFKPSTSRLLETIDTWALKFPPDQYYIDQIQKISDELNNQQIYVQLFTDDKDPQSLCTKIIHAVNKENITWHHHDNYYLAYQNIALGHGI